jgi:hypothetical membrane protein
MRVWSAYRCAGLLRYAALQFLVLTTAAMLLYSGGTWFDPTTRGYTFTHNMLSDLGMTHAFSGRSNTAALLAFGVALGSLGLALVAFSWTWRDFAFARTRAAGGGRTSAVLGTLSGLAFTGVVVTPLDLALWPHNILVICGFGLLALYIGTLTVVMWRNGVETARLLANLAYVVLIVAYIALQLTQRFSDPRGHMILVLGQKTVAYVSMVHIIYLTTATRRAL